MDHTDSQSALECAVGKIAWQLPCVALPRKTFAARRIPFA